MTPENNDLTLMDDAFRHTYPIHQAVKCTLFLRRGACDVMVGETDFISSREIVFSGERVPARGRRVELSVNWPVLLDSICPLQLIVRGHVVRNNQRTAVIRIERHEFRTRKSSQTGGNGQKATAGI